MKVLEPRTFPRTFPMRALVRGMSLRRTMLKWPKFRPCRRIDTFAACMLADNISRWHDGVRT
jgi:hypothetical protein